MFYEAVHVCNFFFFFYACCDLFVYYFILYKTNAQPILFRGYP